MTDCSNKYSKYINALFLDTQSLFSCYLFWKKSSQTQGLIEFFYDSPPFGGNIVVVAGIEEITNLIKNFKFSKGGISFIKSSMESCNYSLDSEFYNYLLNLDMSDITLIGLDSGCIVTKLSEPVLVTLGNLAKLKLLSFAISNLISFSSLIATNSLRMRIVSNKDREISLLEFGLRRAQGPLGGLFASKYSYLAFDAVSNVLSGFYYKIPVKGTCAHAYIMSYQGEYYHKVDKIKFDDNALKLFDLALEIRESLSWTHTNLDELFSFATFTSVYKESSNLLVDTFNTIESGVKNAIIISLALFKMTGKVIRGIRLDSGDLPELSIKAKNLFRSTAEKCNVELLKELKVSASNDINENSINNFNLKGHGMDIYGIGTNLVTCQLQPFMLIKENTKFKSNEEYKKGNQYQNLFTNGKSFNTTEMCSLKKIFETNYNNLIKK
jgi:nicotinate phosphoribosyltransferase